MKSMIAVIVGVAGVATAANAAWGFRYQFSTDNGATWVSNATVDISGGNVTGVRFRVVAYADPGTNVAAAGGAGPAIHFARYTGSELLTNFGSAGSGDAVTSNTFGGESGFSGNAAYTTSGVSGSNFRLGGTAATSFGSRLLLPADLAAFAPSQGGTPKLTYVIRAGTLTVGAAGGVRVINFRNNARTQAQWYRDLIINGNSDVAVANPDGTATDINGVLNVIIPTPGSLALLGLGGLVAARRRRA